MNTIIFPSKRTLTKKCKTCGKVIEKSKYCSMKRWRNNRKYCSIECRGKGMRRNFREKRSTKYPEEVVDTAVSMYREYPLRTIQKHIKDKYGYKVSDTFIRWHANPVYRNKQNKRVLERYQDRKD